MPYKVTAPVARSTAYDFNAQLSKSHLVSVGRVSEDCAVPVAGINETRDVMAHEILFEPRNKLMVNNARLHCASSLNGVKIGTRAMHDVRQCMHT